MKDKPVTAYSIRIFWAIVKYKSRHDGCSPALTDLVEICGSGSKSTIKYHLARLRAAGRIRMPGRNNARGIEVVGGHWTWATPRSWGKE